MTPAICPYLTDHDAPEHMRVTKCWRELKAIRGVANRRKRESVLLVEKHFQEIEAAYLAGEAIDAIARRIGASEYMVGRALVDAGHEVGRIRR
jgi:hypothetical protein